MQASAVVLRPTVFVRVGKLGGGLGLSGGLGGRRRGDLFPEAVGGVVSLCELGAAFSLRATGGGCLPLLPSAAGGS